MSRNNMEFYKDICAQIARKNQYYNIIIVGKNKNQVIINNKGKPAIKNQYFCTFAQTKMVGETSEGGYDPEFFPGYFKIFENDYAKIYISGIKEPDIYAAIDKLKEEYGLN